jgi:hypothetical protein
MIGPEISLLPVRYRCVGLRFTGVSAVDTRGDVPDRDDAGRGG